MELRVRTPPHERVLRRTVPGPNGCVIFTGAKVRGYGKVSSGSRAVGDYRLHQAHRVMYEEMVGPIPDGLQLDHLCRTLACVNHLHLEPVTAQTNTLRGTSPPAVNAVRTHCVRGHEFTPENTRIVANGRACRTCDSRKHRRERGTK